MFNTAISFACVAMSVVFVSINDIGDCNVLLYAMSLEIKGARLSSTSCWDIPPPFVFT